MEPTPHPSIPERCRQGTLENFAIGMTELLCDYREALDRANADKAALRRWYDEYGVQGVRHE